MPTATRDEAAKKMRATARTRSVRPRSAAVSPPSRAFSGRLQPSTNRTRRKRVRIREARLPTKATPTCALKHARLARSSTAGRADLRLLQRAAHHDAFAVAAGDAPAHGISRRVSQSGTRRARLPAVALFSPDSHMGAVQADCLCLT